MGLSIINKSKLKSKNRENSIFFFLLLFILVLFFIFYIFYIFYIFRFRSMTDNKDNIKDDKAYKDTQSSGLNRKNDIDRKKCHPFFTQPLEKIPDDQPIYTILRQFVPPFVCDEIIHAARTKGFDPSTVREQSKDASYRVSETCWLRADNNPTVDNLFSVMYRLSGYDPSTYEELQVVRYVPGGYFHQHFDQCDMSDDYCQSQVERFNGFRLYTLIIALSDPSEYSGGGTYFTHYKELVRLNKGDALLFQNVYPSPEDSEKSCTIDPRSMHEGIKLESGERFIATIWIRGRG